MAPRSGERFRLCVNILFKLLCALLLANVVLRTFTNGMRLLPKILNVIDLGIVLAIWLVALSLVPKGRPDWVGLTSRKLMLIAFVVVFGILFNLSYFYPMAAFSQALMLFVPLLLLFAISRMPLATTHLVKYAALLKTLILINLGLGVVQLTYRLAISGSSEIVHGTFPGNAEQYAAFMMIGVFFFISEAVLDPSKKRKYAIMVLAMLALIISIDNKASWVGMTVSLAIVYYRLQGKTFTPLATVKIALLIVTFGGIVALFASQFSQTLGKYEKMVEAIKDGQFSSLGKVKAFRDIGESHFNSPHMLLVGAGLSNFYSRGCQQFYYSPRLRAKMYRNPEMTQGGGGGGDARASNSMGDWISQSASKPYYDQFYGRVRKGQKLADGIFAVGSIQVDSPYSPYAGLLGEMGLVGTYLYLSIYGFFFVQLGRWINRYRRHEVILPLLLPAYGLLIYMLVNSVYGPFLETTRLTSILWTFIGLVAVYIFRLERAQKQRARESREPARKHSGRKVALGHVFRLELQEPVEATGGSPAPWEVKRAAC